MGGGQAKEEELMSNHTVDLGFAGLDQRRVVELAKVLEKNKVVKKLCLGWNEIGDIGAEKLAESLEKNGTLTELNLTENGIGEKGAERLAQALQTNATLRVLDLMSNRIGDKGAGFFAGALAKNKTLQELRLYDTGIEYSGANRLMNAAERNETLLVLDIRWNDIGDRRLVSRMEQSFARNRGAAAKSKNAPLAQRGDLEVYIISMRDKISSMGEFGPYLCEPERETLRADLDSAEKWLQSNRNATLEEYRAKLDELKSVGDVVALRYKEGIMRGQMITAIYSTIANYRATVESPEETYGDIVPEKRSMILNACNELEQWLTEMRQAQDHLPNFERPVLRCSDMVDKNLELANMVAELLEDSQGSQAEALKEVAATSARGAASARGQANGPSMGSNERRAQLIAYINHLQDKIAVNGEFGAYVSDAERERLNAHLIGASVWASQTTGVPTVHYIEKLQELRSVGDVIEWRCDEDSMRRDWIAAVSSTIANCRNAATQPGDRYRSVSSEKLNTIMTACRELEEWLQSMDNAQQGLAKYERPVLLCADMERRNLELARMVGELLEETKGESEHAPEVAEWTPPPDQVVNAAPAAPLNAAPGRALPPAPGEEEDQPPPPPTEPVQDSKKFMPPMRGTGHTPREGRQASAPPMRGTGHTPREGRQASLPPPGAPPNPAQPRAPSAPPEPGGGRTPRKGKAKAGMLRDAGAPRLTEDERLLELDALDAACSLIVDEDDAPLAGRQMGH